MSARASLRSTGTQLRTDSGRFRTSRVRVCVTVVNGYATADRFGLVCEEKKMRGGPISRVLSGATIYLLRTSPSASSALPERSAGHTIALLHAFAPEGACQAAVLPRRWWSLTPPFQLFSHPQSGQRESSFLRRFPSGYPARPLACFLPCGARTFLMASKTPRGRLAHLA